MMTVRDYHPDDRAACLGVFRSNVPKFFLPHEEQEFEAYLDALDDLDETYLVGHASDDLVACGGYGFDPDTHEGWLSWGMVVQTDHRRGLGRELLLARLDAMREDGVVLVKIDTSQHSRGFFERHGFVVRSETPDGYGPGLHRYELVLSLTPPATRVT